MNDHTPGEWRVGKSGAIVTDCPTPENCEVCKDGHAEFYGGHFICESVGGADARLISQAPGMYDDLLLYAQLVLESGCDCRPTRRGVGATFVNHPEDCAGRKDVLLECPSLAAIEGWS